MKANLYQKNQVLLTYGGLVNGSIEGGQSKVKVWSNRGFDLTLDALYPRHSTVLSLTSH